VPSQDNLFIKHYVRSFQVNLIKPNKIYLIGLLLTGLVGFTIEIWLLIIPEVNDSMGLRLMYFFFSLIALPMGVTFIIKSKLPLSPMDNLFVILVEKTKKNVAIVKTSIEVSFAIVALLYGIIAQIGIGSLSIGTIIITFTIGPGIAFFMKYVKDIESVRKR